MSSTNDTPAAPTTKHQGAIAKASDAAGKVLASGGTDADANRAATDSLIDQMATTPGIAIAQDAPAAVKAAKAQPPANNNAQTTTSAPTAPAAGLPAAGTPAVQTDGVKKGDWIKLNDGADQRPRQVDDVGPDGWVYTKAGDSLKPGQFTATDAPVAKNLGGFEKSSSKPDDPVASFVAGHMGLFIHKRGAGLASSVMRNDAPEAKKAEFAAIKAAQAAQQQGNTANVPQPAQPGTQASQTPSTQGAAPAGTAVAQAEPGTVQPASKDWKQTVYDKIGQHVFRDSVSVAIKNDGQKVLTAIGTGDIDTLRSIANKYGAEAGRNQGGGGAGPGKVKQARRGAEDVFYGAMMAIENIALNGSLATAQAAHAQNFQPQENASGTQAPQAVGGTSAPVGTVAPPSPEKQKALDRIASGKAWFGSGPKAQQFVAQNGLKDTHTVKKTSATRFDVVENETQPATQGATREPQAQETVTPESRSEAPAAAAAVPGASNRPTTWRTNFMSAGVVASSVGINHKGKSLKALVSEIDAHDEQARQASTAPRRLEIGDVLMVGGKEYVINELLGSQVMAQRAVGADGKRVMVARFSEAHALSIRRQRPQEQPAAAGPVAAGEALQSAMGAAGWSAEVAGSGNTIWTKRAKKDRYTAILTPESNSMEITVLVDTVDTQIASFKVADPKDAAIAANKAVSDDVADSVPAVANPKIKAALDKKKGLGGRLAELNAELERQGAVQNANTRAQRDAIRKQIAEQDFPEILKAVDDNIDTAEELNRAFQYAGDEPKAKTIERILKKRGITPEYQKRWSERLMEGQQAGTKPESVVKVPEAIGTAIQEQMEKQKRRVMRRRSEESAPGLNLEQKAAAQTKTKAAEATLRAMRTSIFDAEDAAVKAIETGKASEFEKHADLFPAANDAILAMLGQNDELDAEMQAYEKKSDDQAMLNQMADMDAHPKYNDLDAATHGVTIAFLEDLLATVNAIKPKNPGEKSRLSDRVGYLTSAIAAKKNGASGLGSKAGSNFEAREKWWKGDLTLAGREMALEAAGLKTKYAPSNWSYLPDEVKVKLANLQDSGWVTPDTRKIVTPQIQAAAALDLMGFTKTPTGNGSFTLADSNMRVTVQPTGTGFQARMGSAESGPRLTEQQAIGWAAALRDESIRIQKDEAKGPPATPTAPRVIVNKLGADGLTDAERAAWKPSYADKPANEPTAEQIAAIGDITIEVPTETGTAKMTVNATKALASIDERLDALKMVQRCLA